MKLYSTNGKSTPVTFREAVIRGIADDGGLYMPESFPKLPEAFFKELPGMPINEIGYAVTKHMFGDEVPDDKLREIVDDAINFKAPIRPLDDDLHVLELFRGPTLAFKDYGARFMARMLGYFTAGEGEITILVATSGDTGSAVAHGFYNTPGINVVILYPSGKVSTIQKQQLTTLGGNVTALEIDGTFDDCQALVKKAFADEGLRSKMQLSSANSINIARLFPQSFYYFSAAAQLAENGRPMVFVVPSGNFGNLTAGLFAAEMGLPVHHFIAATNINDVIPEYLETAIYRPRPSIRTISNAMDVGDPSNFSRMHALFENGHEDMARWISGYRFTDDETKWAIGEVNYQYGYIFDPHGAVGYLAAEEWRKENPGEYDVVILETAHPAKFNDVVNPLVKEESPLPERLEACLKKKSHSIKLPKEYDGFKQFLLER